MTTQLIAILASAGLVTAGVAATAQTRSSAAIPVASMVSVSKARVAPGVRSARLAAADQDAESGGSGGSGSGVVLGVAAAALLGTGIYFAVKNDSNG